MSLGVVNKFKTLMSIIKLAEEDWHIPIESCQHFFLVNPVNINKVKPGLMLCWGACHPHATLTSKSSVHIVHSC